MVYIAIKGGRGDTLYCAILCAMKGGSGVPKQRWCWQRISLIPAHTPRSKTLSCKGQVAHRPTQARRQLRAVALPPYGISVPPPCSIFRTRARGPAIPRGQEVYIYIYIKGPGSTLYYLPFSHASERCTPRFSCSDNSQEQSRAI